MMNEFTISRIANHGDEKSVKKFIRRLNPDVSPGGMSLSEIPKDWME